LAYRRVARKRRNRSNGGLSITTYPSMTWVGAVITVSGRRKPGTTVLVTIGFDGGEAFGEDSDPGKSTWSITAACPDEEGDTVPIIASVGSDVVVKTIGRVLLAATPWTSGLGQTLVSGKIEQWAAQDGVHVATQATVDKQPTPGIAVEFDGSNDMMVNSSLGTAYGDDVAALWFACVLRCDTVVNSGVFMFSSGLVSALGEVSLSITAGKALSFRCNDSASEVVAVDFSAEAGNKHLFVGQIVDTTIYGWLDGVSLGSDTLSARVDLSGLDLFLGIFYSTSYPFHGGIYELAFGTTMTTEQRQRLEAALKAKWGTP
jgi:hypothetical protein